MPGRVEDFDAAVGDIPEAMRAAMAGVSWHDDPACPRFEELALVALRHWDFDGGVQEGRLVVAREVAGDVVGVFARLFEARFPIARMRPVHLYGGDDDASMAANNCSAFNFRRIAGTDTLSQHARGRAVDINPVQNPWVRGEVICPPEGEAYLDRSRVRAGMIVRPGPVTEAFDAAGWSWGGDWDDTKDFHHFSASGR